MVISEFVTNIDSSSFGFKNITVSDAFTTSYYNSTYVTKSTDYDW